MAHTLRSRVTANNGFALSADFDTRESWQVRSDSFSEFAVTSIQDCNVSLKERQRR